MSNALNSFRVEYSSLSGADNLPTPVERTRVPGVGSFFFSASSLWRCISQKREMSSRSAPYRATVDRHGVEESLSFNSLFMRTHKHKLICKGGKKFLQI